MATSLATLGDHLRRHIQHEEEVLFPALLAEPVSGEARRDLGRMFDEHRDFADLFRRLRAATGGYQPPAGVNENVARLYRGVAELEALVLRHHHLENHVLMPRFR
jgi:regulator of cell morphogenesis and NO signaling